jgi:two-component system response regulator FixJ
MKGQHIGGTRSQRGKDEQAMGSFPVYVVEDDELSRTLIARQLGNLGRECRMFEHATAFLADAQELDPGIVVLDLRLPGMSGLDLLDQMGDAAGPFAVVVYSASSEVSDAIGAFRRGVIDFLRKPSTPEELARMLEAGDAYLQSRKEEIERRSLADSIKLTAREKEVLVALAAGKQSKAIAYELDISIRTVEMHRANVVGKLNARGTTHALARAKELGLI